MAFRRGFGGGGGAPAASPGLHMPHVGPNPTEVEAARGHVGIHMPNTQPKLQGPNLPHSVALHALHPPSVDQPVTPAAGAKPMPRMGAKPLRVGGPVRRSLVGKGAPPTG